MPQVTFITPSGNKVTLKDVEGNLMEIARDHEIEGIDGDCGGVCSCSTCHVYVANPWLEKMAAADSTETDTLSFDDRKRDNSRLSCQIELTDDLNGLEVLIPAKE
jgi:2Fe-2S ferredoxin